MAVELGGRYDLEAVKRAAAQKRRRDKIKKIVSGCTTAVTLIALAVGGKIGWDKWRAYSMKKEAEAAELAALEERARAESERRKQKERSAAEERKRREIAERKAREERDRKAREDERRRREETKANEAAEREAAKQREKDAKEWQDLHKAYTDRTVAALRFVVNDHITVAAEFEPCVETYVDGQRWVELAAKAACGNPIEFLDTLNDGTVTTPYSESHYPDRETLRALLALLDKEKFVMVVRLHRDRMPGQSKVALLTADLERGLVPPDGARAMKDSAGRVDGWTAPFTYKGDWPLFLMKQSAADKFNGEWSATRRKVLKDAEKLTDGSAFVAARLKSEMASFVNAVKIDISTLRQASSQKTSPSGGETRRGEVKASSRLKGSNGDMRTFRGPTRR